MVTFAITNDWQTTWGFLGDNKNGNVTIHTENKPAFIRAELPKGSFWGVEVKQPKSGVFGTATGGFSPSERIVLTYDIRLPKGFQYGRGGFLPCIYGGRSISKINISCSLIWDKNGSIGLYTDFPNMMNDDVYLSMTTETLPADDEWHTLQIEGSMNTATKGNGTIRLSLDGEQILISNKVMFRTKPTDRFEGISFNAFYRSRNAAVQDASPVDTYIDFANISLKTK